MSKETQIRQECCDIWNKLKDKTKMIDYLIESKQRISELKEELKTKNNTIQLLRRDNIRLKIIYNSLYGIPGKNPKLKFLNQLIRSTYNMNSEELKVYLDLVDDGLITAETPKEEVDQMIEAKLSGDNNE